jgi:hypothetical protein
MPLAFVTGSVSAIVPLPPVTVKRTGTPASGLLAVSRTMTLGATATVVPASAVWSLPASSAMLNAPPGPVAVAVNSTGVSVSTVAVSVLMPTAGPIVQESTRAMPAESVSRVAGVAAPPPCVTVKLTSTSATGLPCVSVTLTAGATATAVPTTAVWPSPASIVTPPAPVDCEVAENVAVTDGSRGVVACTVCVPTIMPSVHVTDARPAESLRTESAEREPPPVATAKRIHSPATPRPSLAVTRAARGVGSTSPPARSARRPTRPRGSRAGASPARPACRRDR